jgi:hypothetical protein
MLKGIAIIATGSPFYGRMAYNLAVTIKAVEDIPVAVLCSGSGLNHLSDRQKKVFDHIIEIDTTAFAAKLSLYDYTPFEKTLYLDADMAWLPKKTPYQLFAELDGVHFTSITEGYYDYKTNQDHGNRMYHYWCNPLEAKERYNLTDKYYQWRSEVIYFEKGSVAKKLFSDAKKIYAKPKVDLKRFAGHVPDELAINIAASKNGIDPHKYKWTPAYWHRLHGEGAGLPQIMQSFYLLSVGGNYATGTMKTCYNNVCMAAHRKLGLQYLFTLQSKKSVIADRVKM